MKTLGRLMKHFRLVSRMARAVGIDPKDATEKGALSQREWAEMVQTCRRCGWTGRCEDWLDTHEAAGCAPEACPNRERFERLGARMAQTQEA